jgi:hypothetical protein
MIKYLGYSLKDALKKVKGHRPIVEPNTGKFNLIVGFMK